MVHRRRRDRIVERRIREARARHSDRRTRPLSMPKYRIPRMWPDSEVFILGGGPSIREVDVDRLRGRCVIAVNNAFKLGDWIPVMTFGDFKWYFWNMEELLRFPGLKITTCQKHDNKAGILCVNKLATDGLSRDPGVIHFNRSSGASAINLATLFGAKRIVLFGFDMKARGIDRNFHREHVDWDKKKNPFNTFLRAFEVIARDLKSMHVECVNANSDTALKEFPVIPIEEAYP